MAIREKTKTIEWKASKNCVLASVGLKFTRPSIKKMNMAGFKFLNLIRNITPIRKATEINTKKVLRIVKLNGEIII